MKIGLALICYQRYDCVEENCHFLSKHKDAFESLIVVDDGSPENHNTHGIQVIKGKNKGVACNKNRALHYLKDCDLIVLIEDDMKIKDLRFLEICRNYLQKSSCHALFYDSDVFLWKNLWKLKNCGGFGELVEYTDISPYNYFYAPGGFIAITQSGLKLAGGLNANFIGLGMEHMEWSWRLSSLGLVQDKIKSYKTLNLQDSLEKFNVERNKRQKNLSAHNKTLYENLIQKPATLNNDYLCLSNLFLENSKIFGIGLSKTGTYSLDTGLKMLGYRSVHYPIYESLLSEIILQSKWSILENHDAITDITAAANFRNLDALYPGSKFILTTRKKNSWMRSMNWHWNQGHTNAPLSENHEKLGSLTRYLLNSCYHGLTWEPERIWKSYISHEKKVLEYFKNRQDDLLVLPLEAPDKWECLCNFLKHETLGRIYPCENVSRIKM